MTNYLVITGGSRGIGRATVLKFKEHHWKVINLARQPCGLPEVVNIKLDLSASENIHSIKDELQAQLKDSDKICLVHNAAMHKPDEISSIKLSDLQRMLAVNVTSAVMLNELVIPLMKKESSIVYIGSVLSEKGVPASASYIISKHAVVGMMRATAQDLAAKGIMSCCICPGLVETDMLRENIDEKLVQQIVETNVLGGRLIQPNEMADAIYSCGTNPLFNGSILRANLGQQVG